MDTDLYDQPSGMGINEVDEGEEDLGEEGSGVSAMDGTYIDDEDLNQSPDRIEIPIHCTVPRKREEETVCILEKWYFTCNLNLFAMILFSNLPVMEWFMVKKKKEKNFKTQPFNHKQIKWQEFLREKNIWFTVVLKKKERGFL